MKQGKPPVGKDLGKTINVEEGRKRHFTSWDNGNKKRFQ